MSLRTIIVALAVPVTNEQESYPAIEACLHELGLHDVQIVSVLDATKPENNYEPQIFAAYRSQSRALVPVESAPSTTAGKPITNDEVPAPTAADSCCATTPRRERTAANQDGLCSDAAPTPGTPQDPDAVAYAFCGC